MVESVLLSMKIGTHSGTFHADDVLAVALLRTFLDPDARVVRTRDAAVLAACDVVVDVGGEYDPATRRFDHHQGSYQGPMSSAGMVLGWLEEEGVVSTGLATHLRHRAIDYVDAVDTGRQAPSLDVPCVARIVESIGQGWDTPEEFHAAFMAAVGVGQLLVKGLRSQHERVEEARAVVNASMSDAVEAGRSVVFLPGYFPWKTVYFENGGVDHPTDYVMFPSEDHTWKVVAIPPRPGCFDQKRPLPESWAGKLGDELSAAAGVEGGVFCHKNRFIAVFKTREAAVEALSRFGLYAARPAVPTAVEG